MLRNGKGGTMIAIKQPTPEEINEAAEKYAFDEIIKPMLDEDDEQSMIDSLRLMNTKEFELVNKVFRFSVSWLQNYQTQQQGAVKTAERILVECLGICDNQDYEVFQAKDSICNVIEIYASQFQTPALGTTDTRSKEQTHGMEKRIEEYAKDYQENTELNNPNAVYYAVIAGFIFGQSSQPQPNAITVIEERVKDLDLRVKEVQDHQLAEIYDYASNTLKSILKIVKQ